MPKPDPTRDLLRDRTRAAVWVALACVGLFALADLGVAPAVFAAAYTVKGILAVFLLLMLLALRGPNQPRRTLGVALATINGTYLLFAVGDVIKGHFETMPQLAVVCALSAAAVLPWGLWPQLTTAVLIGLGSIYALALSGRPFEALVDPAASILASLGVSVYVAHEFARYRRDRVRTEADLAALVTELEGANRLKAEFVSTISHELRTPLNVINGYLDMLEDPDWSDAAFALGRMRHANRELLELIEATLNLNRLDAGQDSVTRERIRLDLLWHDLAGELGSLPHAREVELCWEAVPNAVLHSDRRKLKTIVKNLVGNAVKFSPGGRVVVTYAVDDYGCEITVRDTGIGIPTEHLPHIFEMFRQVDSTDRRAYGGVGLGLHIVQRLTTQLGGRVAVESRPGCGSTFTVRLPIAAQTAADDTTAPRA